MLQLELFLVYINFIDATPLSFLILKDYKLFSPFLNYKISSSHNYQL